MSNFSALNQQIWRCQTELRQTKRERQLCQWQLWQRLQAPLLLLSGFWFGVSLQVKLQAKLSENSPSLGAAKAVNGLPLWLGALWRWWLI
jgi:hypothetical protein